MKSYFMFIGYCGKRYKRKNMISQLTVLLWHLQRKFCFKTFYILSLSQDTKQHFIHPDTNTISSVQKASKGMCLNDHPQLKDGLRAGVLWFICC